MAVYTDIDKIFEDDEIVRYRFTLTDGRSGDLALERGTGLVICEKQLEGDEEQLIFARAKRKVLLAWKTGNYPSRLVWAS